MAENAWCVYANKGGVGKTTLSVNLGHSLALAGKKVLLVDLDAQSNLTRHLGELDPECFTIRDLLLEKCTLEQTAAGSVYERLDVLPGHLDLEDLAIMFPKIMRLPNLLRERLGDWKSRWDVLLIDCPASLNWLTRMAFYATGNVLVPVQPETYSIDGVRDLAGIFDKLPAAVRSYRFLLNMYRGQTQLHGRLVAELRAAFPDRVAKQVVRLNIQLAEAAHRGQSIFEYAPASNGAVDLFTLGFELFGLGAPGPSTAVSGTSNAASAAPQVASAAPQAVTGTDLKPAPSVVVPS